MIALSEQAPTLRLVSLAQPGPGLLSACHWTGQAQQDLIKGINFGHWAPKPGAVLKANDSQSRRPIKEGKSRSGSGTYNRNSIESATPSSDTSPLSSCEGVPPPGTYIGQKKVSAKFFFWITPCLTPSNSTSKVKNTEKRERKLKE